MLADDPLGAERERFETPLPPGYAMAFEAIAADPNNELLVCELDEAVVGVLQITFTPYVTHQGSWRATIEGVRVDRGARGSGVGKAMVEEAVRRARERGCAIVQLTTDATRADARTFYERLGFRPTHVGMKLRLD
ncbi:MAG: GNAT family N-acetyltransferase [Gemmatimonadota bacterium]